MKKLYLWSDDYGALEFPRSKSMEEVISDDFGDIPIVSSVRTGDTANVNVGITSNIKYTKNERYVDSFLVKLAENKITELKKMSTDFKIFVDFVVYDSARKIIEEGVRVHTIEASDVVRLFEVDEDDQCNYIKEKQFQTTLNLSYASRGIGTGVVKPSGSPKWLKIRRISIGCQPKSSSTPKGILTINRTIMDKTIHPVSPTISDVESEMVMIYTSDGTQFGVVDFIDTIRNINLHITISVSGFFSATKPTEDQMEKIMAINAGTSTEPSDPDDPSTKPPCEDHDHGQFFSQFERCDENTPNAGKVISDVDYAENQYEGLCYPYSKVLKDIADIQIGEYVEYVESLTVTTEL